MHRTQVSLTDDQIKALRQKALRRGVRRSNARRLGSEDPPPGHGEHFAC